MSIHGNVGILIALPTLRWVVADGTQGYSIVDMIFVVMRTTMSLRSEMVRAIVLTTVATLER